MSTRLAHMPLVLVFLLSLGGCNAAHADEDRSTVPVLGPAARMRTWAVENDAWGRLGHPSDRDYTMGVPIAETYRGVPQGDVWRWLRSGASMITSALPGGHAATDSDNGDWKWGNATYTPKNLRTAAPQRDDRPYASYMYAGAGYTTPLNLSGDRLLSHLEVGILGLQVSRDVQTAIHRVCCPNDLPRGWDNQVGNGGSPTFLYGLTWQHPYPAFDRPWLHASMQVGAGAEAGYRVRVFGQAALFFGASRADVTYAQSTMPQPVAPDGLAPLGGQPAPEEQIMTPSPEPSPAAERRATAGLGLKDRARGFGGYVAMEASGIAYNELMQGAWSGQNRDRLHWNQYEHGMAQATAGVDLSFLNLWACAAWHGITDRGFSCGNAEPSFHWYLVQGWHSRDVRHGTESSHFWGGLRVSYPLD